MEGLAELSRAGTGRDCMVLASGVGRAAWLQLSRDLSAVTWPCAYKLAQGSPGECR